jgi:hydrogenase small subunit
MVDDGLYAALVRRGMTRRSFLRFCAAMAAALALPPAYAGRIAQAVETAPRIPVIWLRGQACGGNTEAVLRSANPPVAQLLLDILSVEYSESLLAAAGADADLARTGAMEAYPNGYLAVVEGAIPTGADGAYCLVGGRPMADIVREVCDGALGTIALGSCAFDGGTPAAAHGPTDAKGVRVVTGSRMVMLPGCPMNVVNLVATISHYFATKELPPADMMGRPLSMYGNLIHNKCERRAHFEFGEFALSWGDEGAQKEWCLYKLGCKGPEAMGNCPDARYGDAISWNIRAGAGCIGCVMPDFWDSMGPAYKRLGSPVPFMPNLTADMVGTALVGGVAAVAALHGAGMTVRYHRINKRARREAAAAAEAATGTGPAVAAVPAMAAVPATVAVADLPVMGEPGQLAPHEPEAR